MDQQQLLALIQYLGKYGMSEKDIMALFGQYFGLSPQTTDTSQLFSQYMPTFQQINKYEGPDSLRQSIAKEVMSGTPIWQIQSGIQNAIAAGDPGVDAGSTLDDYVSLAKTLSGEFESYNKALVKAQQDNPASKYGITAQPQDKYEVTQLFPGAMEKLAQLYKDRPVNTTMDQSLAARYAADGQTNTGVGTSSVADALDAAKKALKSNVQSYTYRGKDYSLGELRDTLIPMLSKQKSDEDKVRSSQKKARQDLIDYTQSGLDKKNERLRKANIDLNQEEQDWKIAQQDFQKGKISEQALRRAQIEWASANETVARLSGEVSQRKASASAAESPQTSPTVSASGVPIAPRNFGPGSAVSARTTKVDPFAVDVTAGVMKGLQEKIDKSGRTPYGDQMRALAALQRLASGK